MGRSFFCCCRNSTLMAKKIISVSFFYTNNYRSIEWINHSSTSQLALIGKVSRDGVARSSRESSRGFHSNLLPGCPQCARARAPALPRRPYSGGGTWSIKATCMTRVHSLADFRRVQSALKKRWNVQQDRTVPPLIPGRPGLRGRWVILIQTLKQTKSLNQFLASEIMEFME